MKHDDRQDGALTPSTGVAPSHQTTHEAETIGNMFDHSLAEISQRYDVLSLAGQGGMGVVYRVRDRETNDVVAIKILKPEIAADDTLVERFKNELRLSRKITHKNVCRIHDFNRSATLSFITMEFVEGESLREFLYRRSKVPVTEGLPWALQLCEGMHEAHAQGVVHRDLKPENIMLDKSGTAKIMDFGIARSLERKGTLTSTLIGTPAYMAPEQAEGKPIDRRVDVYALGLIMYEMFTGLPAFQADTPVGFALKQVRERPRSPRELEPSVSPRLAEAILKCLEKDPQRRFQSVEQLKEVLVLEGTLSPRSHRTRGHRTSRFMIPISELPSLPRSRVRFLLALIQVMYLVFYLVALARMEDIIIIVGREKPAILHLVLGAVVLTGLIGIAIRLYLFSALTFDFVGLGEGFHLIFLPLLVLDLIWALCPLLLAHKIGVGLALAVTVALIYLPFSQRTLVRIAYGGHER